MEEAVKQSRNRPASVLPEELIVWEILVRLPAKDLLRCRAVCRAWRRTTAATDFLLAHHRHQPSLHLVSSEGRPNVGAAYDTLDLLRRPAERQPVLRDDDYRDGDIVGDRFVLHGSSDGLILLSLSSGSFYLSNPATRQCMPLALHDVRVPRMNSHIGPTGDARVAGMYLHSPTGEYRVLYSKRLRRTTTFSMGVVYYILTVGSSRPRSIGRPIASPSDWNFLEMGLVSHSDSVGPPVFLHDCLYWIRFRISNGIVVFDTIKESFRVMKLPTDARELPCDSGFWHLLEIDGTLGISWGSKNETVLKLWMLQDYETETWSLKYQIELPLAKISCTVENPSPMFRGIVVSKDGDVLIHCLGSRQLFHFDSRGKLLQTLQLDDMSLWHTGFQFKESLLRHAFMEGSRVGIPPIDPQFFIGL